VLEATITITDEDGTILFRSESRWADQAIALTEEAGPVTRSGRGEINGQPVVVTLALNRAEPAGG